MDHDKLNQLRTAIDEIDQRMLQLLAERVKLVLQVGELKREFGVKVYDPERERRVLERIARAAPAPLNPEVARRVFERIIDESRSQEKHHVAEV